MSGERMVPGGSYREIPEKGPRGGVVQEGEKWGEIQTEGVFRPGVENSHLGKFQQANQWSVPEIWDWIWVQRQHPAPVLGLE